MTPDGLTWEDVSSSHIARIAYQPDEASIFVEFTNGDMWKYPGDAEEWQAFRNAESKGRYVHYFLKPTGGERLS